MVCTLSTQGGRGKGLNWDAYKYRVGAWSRVDTTTEHDEYLTVKHRRTFCLHWDFIDYPLWEHAERFYPQVSYLSSIEYTILPITCSLCPPRTPASDWLTTYNANQPIRRTLHVYLGQHRTEGDVQDHSSQLCDHVEAGRTRRQAKLSRITLDLQRPRGGSKFPSFVCELCMSNLGRGLLATSTNAQGLHRYPPSLSGRQAGGCHPSGPGCPSARC